MTRPVLATVDQLAAWTQRERAELPEVAALVLDAASAIVRSEARQRFARGTSTFEPGLLPRVRFAHAVVMAPYCYALSSDTALHGLQALGCPSRTGSGCAPFAESAHRCRT